MSSVLPVVQCLSVLPARSDRDLAVCFLHIDVLHFHWPYIPGSVFQNVTSPFFFKLALVFTRFANMPELRPCYQLPIAAADNVAYR